MQAKIYLAILMVAVLVVSSIPVIAQNDLHTFQYESNYETEDTCIAAMPTFTDSRPTPITELFEFPDFSVIDTNTIIVSHEEAWAGVLYEIDRIAWEFIANNPEFVAYVEIITAENDDVPGVQSFFLPQLSPDMHMARDLNAADGMSLINRSIVNLELGRQASERATNIYPNDLCRQDTLRHFTWARSAAQAFGVQDAQMATNNHEWANAIGAHFGRQEYRNSALTILRRQALFEIAWVRFGVPGQSMGFIDVFDDENIHDFWNNRAGINSVSSISGDPVDAFREAERQGHLIMSDRDVIQSQTMDIFSARWPFHNMYLPNPIPVILGDVDNNGRVDMFDLMLLELFLSDTTNPHFSVHMAAADVDGNGRVDMFDLMLLESHLSDRAHLSFVSPIQNAELGDTSEIHLAASQEFGAQGETVFVSIDLTKNTAGVTTMHYYVGFDATRLELIAVHNRGLLPLTLPNITNNPVSFLQNNGLDSMIAAQGQILLDLEFRILTNAPLGVADVYFTYHLAGGNHLATQAPVPRTVSVTNGSVTVAESELPPPAQDRIAIASNVFLIAGTAAEGVSGGNIYDGNRLAFDIVVRVPSVPKMNTYLFMCLPGNLLANPNVVEAMDMNGTLSLTAAVHPYINEVFIPLGDLEPDTYILIMLTMDVTDTRINGHHYLVRSFSVIHD